MSHRKMFKVQVKINNKITTTTRHNPTVFYHRHLFAMYF